MTNTSAWIVLIVVTCPLIGYAAALGLSLLRQ
jgi:hypothetical protein